MSSYEHSLKELGTANADGSQVVSIERELDSRKAPPTGTQTAPRKLSTSTGSSAPAVRTVGFGTSPNSNSSLVQRTSSSPTHEMAARPPGASSDLKLSGGSSNVAVPVAVGGHQPQPAAVAAPHPPVSHTPSPLPTLEKPVPPAPKAGGDKSASGHAPAAPNASAVSSAGATPGPPEAAGKPPPGKQKKQSEMTKAERRELQERQRAAKEAAKGGGTAPGKKAAAPAAPTTHQPRKPAAAPSSTTAATAGSGAAPPSADATARKISTSSEAVGSARKLSTQPASMSQSASSAVPGRTAAEESKKAAERAAKPHDDKAAKAHKRRIIKSEMAAKQVPLFAHLPQYEPLSSLSLDLNFSSEIHPCILALGLKYAHGTIRGGNARCMAMLRAFKDVISSFATPEGKVFGRVLDAGLKPQIQFLVDCRPLSISMANAINALKIEMTNTTKMGEAEAKRYLLEKVDSYVEQRIILADEVISSYASSKINNGDVILTYAASSVVEMTFKKAFDAKKRFRVVVVDAPPKHEGKALLKRLVAHGIDCTYILLSAISYIMKEVSKVMVGAAALMNTGSLLSRVGTGVVALMAHANHKPFLVCCETYKFCERVHLDSITYNEIGNPDELRHSVVGLAGGNGSDPLANWRDEPQLKLLNLAYDVTPTAFIMMVITEYGMIPPTSVPVVIREYHTDPPSYLE